MDDRLRPHLLEQPVDQIEVGQVAEDNVRTSAVGGLERVEARHKRRDRQGRTTAHLRDPIAAETGVDAGNLVAAGRQVLGQRPTEIAVDSSNEKRA